MRIAAIHSPNGKIFGTVENGQFLPLLCGGREVRDLREVIALVHVGNVVHGLPVALDPAMLRAPVGPLAKNVICVGKNYHDHAQEFARSGIDQSGDKLEVPDAPVVFTKAVTSLADPGQPIPASADSTHSTDYEGELGVVIGKTVRNVQTVQDAYGAVFGYTIVNDVTARTVQQKHKQWFLGKSLTGYCPAGPYLVTADEFGLPDAQELITTVNGEPRQRAKLRDLIFDVPAIIRAVSAYVPLEPGDLIATGTPAGVGIGFKPPRYLKAGDSVSIAITGIGTLTNPVA